MSGHGQRQQKKLAKKKAKRAAKRTSLTQRDSSGLEPLLRHAGEWPIVEAMVPENLWQRGLGQLIIARKMPDERIAFAAFLVDTYCLGVKDAFCNILSPFAYREFVDKVERMGQLEPVKPEAFAKLVAEAVQYARAIGIEPHPDYQMARLLLAGIDPSLATERYEFGKDGKPFYIQGPYDSPAMMARMAAQMNAAGGKFVHVVGEISDDVEDDDMDAIDR